MSLQSFWRMVLLLTALIFPGCGSDVRETNTGIGLPLPSAILTGLGGESTTSTDALRGVPLIINFWASWCVPCREEMPSLEKLSQRLAGRGGRVIGISVDDDLNLAAEFVLAQRISFPIYAERGGKTLQSSLRVKSLPETILVTAEGVIAARIAGGRDWNSAYAIGVLEDTLRLRFGAGL